MHIYKHDSMADKQEAGEKHTHRGHLVLLSSLDIVTQLVWYVARFVFFLKSIKLGFVQSSLKNMGVKKK